MRDARLIAEDLSRRQAEVKRFLAKDFPKLVAGAAERIKDASFSAQGFIVNGSPRPKWAKRSKETSRTRNKRVLHATGILQSSVKARVQGVNVAIGVDVGLVPYARVMGEGGRIQQYVKPHHRKNPRGGKRVQVRGFSRKLTYPARPYIGYSPDIFRSAERDAKPMFDKIFR